MLVSEPWILLSFLKDPLSLFLSISYPRGYSVDELEDHISQLHEYNDIKDIGQMLLGKLGEQQDPRGPARAQREGGSISPGVWILLLGPLTCQPSHPSQLAHCSNAPKQLYSSYRSP